VKQKISSLPKTTIHIKKEIKVTLSYKTLWGHQNVNTSMVIHIRMSRFGDPYIRRGSRGWRTGRASPFCQKIFEIDREILKIGKNL
jgi:hypothetical protein